MILVIAMLITPGATAHLLTEKFQSMVIASVSISLSTSFAGVYLSFYIDSAPAPTIVVLMTVVFILVFIRHSINAKRASSALLRSESRMPSLFDSQYWLILVNSRVDTLITSNICHYCNLAVMSAHRSSNNR